MPLIVGGVVYQHVHGSKLRQHPVDRGTQGPNVGQVTMGVFRGMAFIVCQRLHECEGRLILHVKKRHPRALPRKMADHGFANARGSRR